MISSQAVLPLVGRVKATSRSRLTPVFPLVGRVKTTSAARAVESVYLSGRTKALSASRAVIGVPLETINLRGHLKAASGSNSRDLFMATQPIAFIDGKITTTSALRTTDARAYLFGRVKTTSALVAHTTDLKLVGISSARSGSRTDRLYDTPNFINLAGSIKATSSAVADRALPPTKASSVRSSMRVEFSVAPGTPLQIFGKIKATSKSRNEGFASKDVYYFSGNIFARSGAALDAERLILLEFFGKISARSSLVTELAPANAIYLFAKTTGGVTSAKSDATLFQGVIYLEGKVAAQSAGRWRFTFGTFPFALPASVASARSRAKWIGYQFLNQSRIKATSRLRTAPTQPVLRLYASKAKATSSAFAEIEQLLVYDKPPPVPTRQLESFLELVTSEHNQQPDYMETVGFSISPYVDDLPLVTNMPLLFDVDWAVGEQEDFVGQWIGRTRFVNLGDVFFTWDALGLGWDQANWRGPFDPPESLVRLDDYHYRLLLYATIVANHWDGSIPSAYHAWDTLFAGTGIKVLIQDYGNMTMMYGLMAPGVPDRVLQALLTNGHMDLRPEGIELLYYVFQAVPRKPYFAFDSESPSVNGFDVGYWGVLIEPGGAYLPQPTLEIEGVENE